MGNPERPLDVVESFTDTELHVFKAIAQRGMLKKQIVHELGIAHTSICYAVRSMLKKTGTSNDYQLIAFYYTKYLPALWKETKRIEAILAKEQTQEGKEPRKMQKVKTPQGSVYQQLPLFNMENLRNG